MLRIQVQPPANHDRGPSFLEPVLENWLSARGSPKIRLGIGFVDGEIRFFVETTKAKHREITEPIKNAFPGAETRIVQPEKISHAKRTHFRLSPDAVPLECHQQFIEVTTRRAIDPLEGVLEAIKSGKSGNVGASVWLELTRARNRRVNRAKRDAPYIEGRFLTPFLKRSFQRQFSKSGLRNRLMRRLFKSLAQKRVVPEDIQDKLTSKLYTAKLWLDSETLNKHEPVHRRFVSRFQSAISVFTPLSADFIPSKGVSSPFLISVPEIASLWHFPLSDSGVPHLSNNSFRELPPPIALPILVSAAESTTVGQVRFRDERQKVVLDSNARRRHVYVVGKTGMGKSTLLKRMIAEDCQSSRGLAVIDPHGDLAESCLDLIPKRRTNDVIWFDPASANGLIPFNPLNIPVGSNKTLVADGVLSAFRKVFGLDESTSPRLLYIFRNCLLTLVDLPEASLLDVQKILVEPTFRKQAIAQTCNPIVRSFWLNEFQMWKANDRTQYIASLQNKLGAFLTNPILQSVLQHRDSKIDLRKIMDRRQVLLVNLSKGRMGEDASNLLGSLLVTSLQLAAMSRANVPESQRNDFGMFVDEFQNFATPSIATFLSEARKYGAHLILAHQFISQLPDSIREAVLGNVGNQFVFQVGATDAKILAQQLTLENESDLLGIPRFHAYCRLAVPGATNIPFSIKTLVPKREPTANPEKLMRVSFSRYGRKSSKPDTTAFSFTFLLDWVSSGILNSNVLPLQGI